MFTAGAPRLYHVGTSPSVRLKAKPKPSTNSPLSMMPAHKWKSTSIGTMTRRGGDDGGNLSTCRNWVGFNWTWFDQQNLVSGKETEESCGFHGYTKFPLIDRKISVWGSSVVHKQSMAPSQTIHITSSWHCCCKDSVEISKFQSLHPHLTQCLVLKFLCAVIFQLTKSSKSFHYTPQIKWQWIPKLGQLEFPDIYYIYIILHIYIYVYFIDT